MDKSIYSYIFLKLLFKKLNKVSSERSKSSYVLLFTLFSHRYVPDWSDIHQYTSSVHGRIRYWTNLKSTICFVWVVPFLTFANKCQFISESLWLSFNVVLLLLLLINIVSVIIIVVFQEIVFCYLNPPPPTDSQNIFTTTNHNSKYI